MNTYQQPKIFIVVDCAIFGYQDGELKLLLYPSVYEPHIGEWSLVGGFVQEDETVGQTAKRVLKERLENESVYVKEVCSFSKIDRDSFGRVISLLHYALVRIDDICEEMLEKSGAKWFSLDDLPDMILDYDEMVQVALKQLRKDSNSQLLGKELLPQKFTLLQLRKVYECIFMQEFEPANFRKKIMSLKVLLRHNEKNKSESKKGAFYYSFNPMAEDRSLDRIVKLH